MSARLRRILPALALTACAAALLTLAVSAATPRELADEYCRHTNAAWCVDADGDGTRESAPQLHPLFTEEGIERLREKGRYFDPNDVIEPDPTATPTPTPTPTPGGPPATLFVDNLREFSLGGLEIGDLGIANTRRATGFSTGGASGGYTLVSVTAAFSAPTGDPGDIVVAVHESSGGVPADAALVTLAGGNPMTTGRYTYTCSGSCGLAADTGYFLVVSAPNATTSAFYNWNVTSSNNERNVPPGNGWSLADIGKYKRGAGSWENFTSDLSGQFEIAAR